MTARRTTSRHDLDVPGIGPLAMRVTVLERGHVRYIVRGPHIRGTFVVIPEALHDGTVLPSTVRVQYGDDADPSDNDMTYYSTHRPDEPVIYNVRLHGWTSDINPDDPPSGYFLGRYATCLRDNGVNRELSTGVRRRTETVLRAIVAHWAALDQRLELITAAARHKAVSLAEHEDEKASALEAEAAELKEQRRQARARLNAVLGVVRRRPLPIRAADPAPVSVPIVDDKGESMGVLTVREVAVNEALPGTVVYEVEGARVHGRVTVGRDRFRPLPLPVGLRTTFGHVRSTSPYDYEHEDEPTVNGVRISGLWDTGTTGGITPTAPASLSARARTGVRAGISASWATERRASGVLRALALRYLARPDVEALQLAAAKGEAAAQQGQCRERLRELRSLQREKESRAARHRRRQRQYCALLA
ncbi:hypothetical protein [Streptomyces sp. MT206]|uniref:hypothetical protein n=1 Tax=Streptomyces sp. MT206 TaxID=3031407 RepID=UPI002FC8262C